MKNAYAGQATDLRGWKTSPCWSTAECTNESAQALISVLVTDLSGAVIRGKPALGATH